MTAETDIENRAGSETLSAGHQGKSSLFGRIGKLFKDMPDAEIIVPNSSPTAIRTSVRIGWENQPFMLALGDIALEFHPDLSITGDQKESAGDWIVHPGHAFYDGVPMFIRIEPGQSVILGRKDDAQKRIFGFDKSVADRHVKIFDRKGELTIQPLELERPTRISAIDAPMSVWATRRANLQRLPDVLGHPLTQFDDEEALDIVRDINGVLAEEAYRDRDDEGLPGGIIQFPDDMTVVIMGDVHARADNVLRVITEGGLLAALEHGEACLVFLGDLVHSQEAGELEDMSSSVFILDLFSMLKRRFPANVFYVHGNHESFSPDVGKGGVPQALLFRKHLKKLRGKAYAAEIENLFGGLAFVVQGNEFVACHGGPVRSNVDRNILVNIQRYPGIQHELVWNRLRQANRPAGYGKGSVKRFRRTLNLSKQAALIVAHTPLSSEQTYWLNVGDITGHHIVYSAHTHRVAAVVMNKGQAIPLEFAAEPAMDVLISSLTD